MFEKKEWKDRVSEYPTRRGLKKSDGTVDIVTVSREEGSVSVEGDAFSAENMNDLEERVSLGFLDSAFKVIRDYRVNIFVLGKGSLNVTVVNLNGVIPSYLIQYYIKPLDKKLLPRYDVKTFCHVLDSGEYYNAEIEIPTDLTYGITIKKRTAGTEDSQDISNRTNNAYLYGTIMWENCT